MRGPAAVVHRNDRLGDLRDLVVRAIEEVERRFLVREEREVEDLALVPAVRARDREAALDRELATRGIETPSGG